MTEANEVDAYLAGVPEPARRTLSGLRALIKAHAPSAVEGFSYGMPGYKYRGRPLVYFASAKNHCALYGLDTAVAGQAGYDTSQKGTIRFAHDARPPDAFVRQLLDLRVAAIEAAEDAKRQKRRKSPA